MRKIYLVPNFITTANMCFGFYSIICSIEGNIEGAAWAIVVAAVFDMLDGRIARLARATSRFGVEYDSLSDLVSFGIAPALLLYQWALKPFERLGWLVAFLFAACGALRLARFNVSTGNTPKNTFQGLPIPIAAGLVSTLLIFNRTMDWLPLDIPNRAASVTALILTLSLSILMVSTMPFPSFKELNWRSRASFGYLLVGVLSMILVAVRPEITMFLILVCYTGLSLIWNLMRLLTGARARPQQEAITERPIEGA